MVQYFGTFYSIIITTTSTLKNREDRRLEEEYIRNITGLREQSGKTERAVQPERDGMA